jgi:hypothetical protein
VREKIKAPDGIGFGPRLRRQPTRCGPTKNTTDRRKSPDSEYLVGAPTCSRHQTVENDR